MSNCECEVSTPDASVVCRNCGKPVAPSAERDGLEDKRPEPPTFRGEWYSVCSAHRRYEPSCRNCNAGRWISEGEAEFSNWLWKYSRRIWRKWANRKPDQFLETVFPKLHGTHAAQTLADQMEAWKQRAESAEKELAELRQECPCGCGQVKYELAPVPHAHTADFCACRHCEDSTAGAWLAAYQERAESAETASKKNVELLADEIASSILLEEKLESAEKELAELRQQRENLTALGAAWSELSAQGLTRLKHCGGGWNDYSEFTPANLLQIVRTQAMALGAKTKQLESLRQQGGWIPVSELAEILNRIRSKGDDCQCDSCTKLKQAATPFTCEDCGYSGTPYAVSCACYDYQCSPSARGAGCFHGGIYCPVCDSAEMDAFEVLREIRKLLPSPPSAQDEKESRNESDFYHRSGR